MHFVTLRFEFPMAPPRHLEGPGNVIARSQKPSEVWKEPLLKDEFINMQLSLAISPKIPVIQMKPGLGVQCNAMCN